MSVVIANGVDVETEDESGASNVVKGKCDVSASLGCAESDVAFSFWVDDSCAVSYTHL